MLSSYVWVGVWVVVCGRECSGQAHSPLRRVMAGKAQPTFAWFGLGDDRSTHGDSMFQIALSWATGKDEDGSRPGNKSRS